MRIVENGGINVKKSLILISAVLLVAFVASAGAVNYSTTGAMSCNAVAGCVADGTNGVTIGGISLVYDGVTADPTVPSISGLGNIVTTGTGTNVSFVGVTLVITIDDISLSMIGAMPTGTLGGAPGEISTNTSSAIITFAPSNTTTAEFGTLPGVALTSGATTDTFQFLNTTYGIEDPSDPAGANKGVTSLQGDVVETTVSATPEPMTLGMLGFGLIGLGLMKRKRSVR
jgi:hypothetical protein